MEQKDFIKGTINKNNSIMSEDNQQEQQNSGSEQIPERIEPVFQTEDIIIRSLDDDINQK